MIPGREIDTNYNKYATNINYKSEAEYFSDSWINDLFQPWCISILEDFMASIILISR